MPVGVAVPVAVRVRVGVRVPVGVLVGHEGHGVGVAHPVKVEKRKPQPLSVPLSRGAVSMTMSIQVPLPSCPSNVESGSDGVYDAPATSGQSTGDGASSSKVIPGILCSGAHSPLNR